MSALAGPNVRLLQHLPFSFFYFIPRQIGPFCNFYRLTILVSNEEKHFCSNLNFEVTSKKSIGSVLQHVRCSQRGGEEIDQYFGKKFLHGAESNKTRENKNKE